MLMTSAFLPEPWQTAGQRYSQTDKFNHDGPLVKIDGMEELKGQTLTGSTTLFALNGRAAVTNQQAIGIQLCSRRAAGPADSLQPCTTRYGLRAIPDTGARLAGCGAADALRVAGYSAA